MDVADWPPAPECLVPAPLPLFDCVGAPSSVPLSTDATWVISCSTNDLVVSGPLEEDGLSLSLNLITNSWFFGDVDFDPASASDPRPELRESSRMPFCSNLFCFAWLFYFFPDFLRPSSSI